MKKFIYFSILFICVILVTGCGGSKYLKEVSYKEYKEMIKNKETFILEIMKTDCSACKDFKPKLTKVVNDYKIEVKYLNTAKLSKKDTDELFDLTGIEGTPTVIFYTDGEEETKSSRINGSVTEEKIISKFKASGYIKEKKN